VPLLESEVDDKFSECFGLGVRPLDAGKIACLTGRARNVEDVPDMSRFFDTIC